MQPAYVISGKPECLSRFGDLKFKVSGGARLSPSPGGAPSARDAYSCE